jgi:hypothetical protein
MSNSEDDRYRVKTTSLGVGGDLHQLVTPTAYDSNPPPVLAKASFGIYGNAVDIAFWTDYFKCEPSDSRAKSEDRGFAPSGRRYSIRPAMWLLSTEVWVNNDLLDPHLSFLVAKLALPRSALGALLRERTLTSRVFCFWQNDSGDRVPDVRTEYLDIFRACEIGFEIDEYPQQIGILDSGKTYKAWI